MLRKCVHLVAAACIVMVVQVSAMAAEQEGSLFIRPAWEENAVPGGLISVCRVGSRSGEGFRITDGLANWEISEEEFYAQEWCQWLPDRSKDIMLKNVDGIDGVRFSGLKEGIYFVRQNNSPDDTHAFLPFIVTVPQEGKWEITAEPKVIRIAEAPATGDHPAPIIGAMGLGLSAAILMVLADERKK